MFRSFNWKLALFVAVLCAIALPFLPHQHDNIGMIGLLPILAGTISDSVAQDKSGYFTTDTLRAQHNIALQDFTYFLLNRIISATAATYPVIAKGTGNVKPKSTNATVVLCAGALNEVGAADDAWTLTGDVLAASKYRRYLLLVDAADAKTVLASDDAATLAACRFPSLPANGKAIMGVCNVGTDASHTFTPDTTHLDAAGITTTYQDGIDIYVPLAKLVTP